MGVISVFNAVAFLACVHRVSSMRYTNHDSEVYGHGGFVRYNLNGLDSNNDFV